EADAGDRVEGIAGIKIALEHLAAPGDDRKLGVVPGDAPVKSWISRRTPLNASLIRQSGNERRRSPGGRRIGCRPLEPDKELRSFRFLALVELGYARPNIFPG